MSSIFYVVPWAICDTDRIYIRKTENDGSREYQTGEELDDWTIQKIHTDKKTGDLYILLDVYRGCRASKGMARDINIVSLTNSVHFLQELGYRAADEQEADFIRSRVMRIRRKKAKDTEE